MRTGGRRERVAEAIRREVAGILRFELADPRVGRATVTRVELTGDLTLARVYVSVYGSDADQKETLAVLGRARGRVRTLLGSRIRLRATPEIRFVFDPSVEFSIRLEQILDQERAAHQGTSGDESPEGGDGEPPVRPGEEKN
ncbi:MAG: 30S ribosome-binding factor RbfA [Acidobacteria bacterium]|nr:30S ribosome-binding factor RbfA [Acidobacteriota bacterium]MYF15531.1 30S ribosome-binding factor RbfA [Acidobacteriota bacterium]MYI96571.1 30S ribosome-binding factor RbfA [Acidobacteriota bacterium]